MNARPKQTKAATPRAPETADAELKQCIEFFDLAPMAYLVIGTDRIIRRANFAAADLLGSARERLPGADLGSFVADKSRPVLSKFLTRVFASGTRLSCELDLSREQPQPLSVRLFARSGSSENEYLVAMAEIQQLNFETGKTSTRSADLLRSSLKRMSSDYYWMTDTEHRITTLERSSKRSNALSHLGDLSRGLRRWEVPYLSPDQAGWAQHQAVLAARQPFRDFQISRMGADGKEHHISLSGEPLFDQDGGFVGYHGLGRDVTEHIETENKLRLSEARLRSLIDMSSDFFWETDAEHRFTRQSTGLVKVLEAQVFRDQAHLGLRRWEIPYVSPDEAGWQTHRKVLEAHLPFRNFEVSRIDIDGSVRSFVSSGDPMFDASGAFTGYFGMGLDITERKRTEKILRESEERYRKLFAYAGVGIVILSRNGDILAANEAFARMHGYSINEVMNLGPKDLLPPEAYRLAPARWRRILSGEFVSVEVPHRHKDGHLFPTEVSGSMIPLGDESQMLFFARDITERKRSEAALLAANQKADDANRAKTRFLAAASHDLRQPVQAINLFLDALAQTFLSEEQKEISRYLGMSVSSLREMLGTLLDISQLDAGAVKPNLEMIRAEDLLHELNLEFAHVAKQKNLRFKFRARPGVLLVADVSMILRALRNVIENAIKCTEQGGILIGARRRGDRALIQVWDTGIGIAPEHAGKIFDEYFQIDNRARDRAKGMGLGLSIVDRLVKLLGGKISCRSRLGRGSLFEISLPLAHAPLNGGEKPLQQSREAIDAVELSRFIGRRGVVIEDDYLIAKGIAQALGALGATVALFRNAEEALASGASAAADFYISDFELPGRLNGVELLDTIQRRSSYPINAVLITGKTSSSRMERSASSKWKVLFKPVDLQALLAAM